MKRRLFDLTAVPQSKAQWYNVGKTAANVAPATNCNAGEGFLGESAVTMSTQGRFLIDEYRIALKVWPVELKGREIVHGSVQRLVETDNFATIRYAVTFSKDNAHSSLFRLRYLTQNYGYIWPPVRHGKDETSPVDLGRYEAYGTEVYFDFTPQRGREFGMDLQVMKAFDQGHRNAHFHLCKDASYRLISCTLDLAGYLGEGYTITKPPQFYYHDTDLEHGDLCRRRPLSGPLAAVDGHETGIWRWEIRGVEQGIVDLVWDVTHPARPENQPPGGVIHIGPPKLVGDRQVQGLARMGEKTYELRTQLRVLLEVGRILKEETTDEFTFPQMEHKLRNRATKRGEKNAEYERCKTTLRRDFYLLEAYFAEYFQRYFQLSGPVFWLGQGRTPRFCEPAWKALEDTESFFNRPN
jgi:hypothetical protein